jgi:hypothetical protein
MTRRAKLRRKNEEQPGLRFKPLMGPAIIVLAAMVAIWPQIVTGPSCNGDFYFHFVSWTDAQRSMLQAIFYPHWANSPNFGYGEPRFVFYPPVSWMAGALMGLLLPWRVVPLAFNFLLLAGTGLANRILAREMMEDGPATLAGCAAIFLGRGISDISLRNDYAELTGGFWIPLLLLFLLRRRNTQGRWWEQAFDGSAMPLALVMAGIWLSNGPLGIEASYLLLAVALLSAAVERSWAPIVRATTGVMLGMGLDAFYLVPAIWERRWANFQEAVTRRDFRIENSWLFEHHADPVWSGHDELLTKVSLIGAAMFALTMIAMVVAWKRGKLPREGRWRVPLLTIPFVVLFLLLPVSLPIWNWLPELRVLQFPWRWLLVMQTPLAVFFALAVWVVAPRKRIAILAACAVMFVAVSTAAWAFCRGDCRAFNTSLENWAQAGGAYGKPEYAPPGIQYKVALPDVPSNCVIGTLSDLENISGEPGETVHAAEHGSGNLCSGKFDEELNLPEMKGFSGVVDQAGYLVLRLRSYPAWQVRLNGRVVSTTMERGHGLMAVPVTPGPVNVVVRWTTTPDVVAGRWISVLAVAMMVGLFFGERRLAMSRTNRLEPKRSATD